MEKYNLKTDITVFGKPVLTFPSGIGDAFEALVKMIPDGFNRSYYGISKMENSKMTYIAAAEELNNQEAEKYNCNRYIIERGDYLTIALADWQTKTDSIKDVFDQLVKDNRTDKSKPGIEWYKNEKEMLCMMKALPVNK
jgi:hypothetical protein